MWNIAFLDGEWLWFDATSDRGLSMEYGFKHFGPKELDSTQYRWEDDSLELLLECS